MQRNQIQVNPHRSIDTEFVLCTMRKSRNQPFALMLWLPMCLC